MIFVMIPVLMTLYSEEAFNNGCYCVVSRDFVSLKFKMVLANKMHPDPFDVWKGVKTWQQCLRRDLRLLYGDYHLSVWNKWIRKWDLPCQDEWPQSSTLASCNSKVQKTKRDQQKPSKKSEEEQKKAAKESETDQKATSSKSEEVKENRVTHEPMNSQSMDEPMRKLLEHLRKNWY